MKKKKMFLSLNGRDYIFSYKKIIKSMKNNKNFLHEILENLDISKVITTFLDHFLFI